jgi:hypothetical protein
VVVAPNRKGDIVVREGQDLETLVKSFVISYGLKKDMHDIILESLEKVVKNTLESLE